MRHAPQIFCSVVFNFSPQVAQKRGLRTSRKSVNQVLMVAIKRKNTIIFRKTPRFMDFYYEISNFDI